MIELAPAVTRTVTRPAAPYPAVSALLSPALTRVFELRSESKALLVVTRASTPSGTSMTMLDAPAFTSMLTAAVDLVLVIADGVGEVHAARAREAAGESAARLACAVILREYARGATVISPASERRVR